MKALHLHPKMWRNLRNLTLSEKQTKKSQVTEDYMCMIYFYELLYTNWFLKKQDKHKHRIYNAFTCKEY